MLAQQRTVMSDVETDACVAPVHGSIVRRCRRRRPGCWHHVAVSSQMRSSTDPTTGCASGPRGHEGIESTSRLIHLLHRREPTSHRPTATTAITNFRHLSIIHHSPPVWNYTVHYIVHVGTSSTGLIFTSRHFTGPGRLKTREWKTRHQVHRKWRGGKHVSGKGGMGGRRGTGKRGTI